MSNPPPNPHEEISRLKAQLEAAETNCRQAETESQLKDEFLAQVAHELRTPLNAVVGWVQVLQSKGLTEEELDHGLEVINQNTLAQAKLIEDLLDVTRVVSRQLSLDFRPVSVPEVIESAINAVMPRAREKEIEIKWAIHPGRNAVQGDASRLQQVVWNLLVNAVKFTPKGGKVRVVLEQDPAWVRIRIADTGKGIKPEELPTLFGQWKKTAAREQGGLGIGLFLVKSLIELHQGNVSVSSPGEGQGAEFIVALPQLREPRTAAMAGDKDICATRLDGLRLLIVDDDKDSREALSHLLSSCGAEVRVSSSARAALECLDDFQPSLLVSDLSMPDMDGFAFVEAIRRRRTAKELPAIALSAFAHREVRQRALRLGFQAHLAKPLDLPELVASISAMAR